MKKKENSRHNRDGAKRDNGRPKEESRVDKSALLWQAKARLEKSMGGSGSLSKRYPNPWGWVNGVLKDARGGVIPGVQRFRE